MTPVIAKPKLEEPQENLLYLIEKYSPLLQPWEREIVRIIRKISQYFYPQRQTQVMNEGWATFWHYTILYQLFEEDIVGDGFMMEFLQSHTNVVYQPPVSSKYYNGNREPNIQVWSVDRQGDRALTLRHNQYLRRPLNNQTAEVLKHVTRLWGFDVYLETVDSNNQIIATQECKLEKRKGRRG